jgi:MFS family permease
VVSQLSGQRAPSSWLHVGFFATWPFLAAAIGILFGGWISDRLLKRTGSVNISRKLPIISGLLLSSCIIAANWVSANSTVIIIMSVAFFGQGMVGLGWTLISDIAPENMAGLTGGIFNFCANMASIIAPLIIGVIISATGNFFYALIYVGLTALIGVIAYILSSAISSVSSWSRPGAAAIAGARGSDILHPAGQKQRHQRNRGDCPVDAGVASFATAPPASRRRGSRRWKYCW